MTLTPYYYYNLLLCHLPLHPAMEPGPKDFSKGVTMSDTHNLPDPSDNVSPDLKCFSACIGEVVTRKIAPAELAKCLKDYEVRVIQRSA